MILNSSYDTLKSLVKNKKFPLVICDLDVFNQNLERVGKYLRKTKKSLRLCTKSVRVPELVNKVEKEDFVNGIFTYNSAEALFYAEKYKTEDILLGYPIMSKVDIEELCQAAKIDGVRITVMVDDTKQVDLLERIAAKNNVEFGTLIEIDVADKLLGRNVGVYRSPIRKPEMVVNLARIISKKSNLNFRGIMGYEAQNASIGDEKMLFRFVKRRSRKHVNIWRQNVVEALTNAGFQPEVVNGGGSGCYQETAAESSITEIGIGSLLFKSHIFDTINSLNDYLPSLFFILQIVRKPLENIATAFSGGYVSSGSVRALPLSVIPKNLKILKDEGFGEVQTPFIFDANKLKLNLGDPIFCRFGKAGEPLEHFNKIFIYSNGELIDKYKTYRGYGKRFS
ncbi:MAG: alanine racemase [Candidatus Lokiarchaeota archaeon]|nr:alanine racemase [Candidatus Lokiarchaeota archaeon]